MAKQTNALIREEVAKHRMYYYEVCELLNISESTWGRMMRKELPQEEQERIVKLIKKSMNKR